MASIPGQPAPIGQERRSWVSLLAVRDVAVSMAITAIWTAVIVVAIWGPDIVSTSGGGTDTATVPSAVPVSMFAFLASWVVARWGFKTDRRD